MTFWMKLELAWMVLFGDIVGEGETTSPRVASIASRCFQKPWQASAKDVKSMAGSLLTRAHDKDRAAK